MNSLRALNETIKWYRTFVRLTKSLSSCSEDTNNPCGFVFISILILPEFITDSIKWYRKRIASGLASKASMFYSSKVRQFRLKNIYKPYDFTSCSTTKIENVYFF